MDIDDKPCRVWLYFWGTLARLNGPDAFKRRSGANHFPSVLHLRHKAFLEYLGKSPCTASIAYGTTP